MALAIMTLLAVVLMGAAADWVERITTPAVVASRMSRHRKCASSHYNVEHPSTS